MNYQLTSYAIAQFVTAGVSLIVAVMMWNRRSTRSGWQLFLLFAAIFEWALATGMESAATTQALKVFWSKAAYIGAQISPVLLMLFALNYTGRMKRFKPVVTALLFVIPILIILLAATNEKHGLIWIAFSPGPSGTNSMIYHHGPAFWLGIAYIFTMVAFATTFLIVFTVRTQRVYRFQHFIIVLASIMPWAGSIIYLFNLSPFPGLDTTTLGFLFTGILLLIGISRGKLMNYIPIAHELLFENIDDGIIVFDENLRVVDINPGAEKHLSLKFKEIVGQSIGSNPKISDSVLKQFKMDENSRFEMISPFLDDQTWFNVSISPLRNSQQNFLGWVVFFENISRRKETERKLRKVNQKLEHQLKEIRELEDQLREQANCDCLTGVYNRGYLEETLMREVSRAQRKSYPLSVIMLDVDEFKVINDTHGHKAGDEVIIALGKMLQSSTRAADCVSRYGGDEFILVMPEMSREDAFQCAEAWRNECKALMLKESDKLIQFTISIGIATFPLDGKTNETLLSKVDHALYDAKQSDRDCTRMAGNN